FYNYEPLGGNATLSIVVQPRLNARFGRLVDISISQYDGRIAPAEFQDGFLKLAAGFLSNCAPRGHTSCQCYRMDTIIFNNLPHLVIISDYSVKQLLQSCLMKNRLNFQRAAVYVRSMAEQNRIPGHQR